MINGGVYKRMEWSGASGVCERADRLWPLMRYKMKCAEDRHDTESERGSQSICVETKEANFERK